jgi:hypothetical protein
MSLVLCWLLSGIIPDIAGFAIRIVWRGSIRKIHGVGRGWDLRALQHAGISA